jgi:hypothetical protein
VSFGTIASQITEGSIGVVEFLVSSGSAGMVRFFEREIFFPPFSSLLAYFCFVLHLSGLLDFEWSTHDIYRANGVDSCFPHWSLQILFYQGYGIFTNLYLGWFMDLFFYGDYGCQGLQ